MIKKQKGEEKEVGIVMKEMKGKIEGVEIRVKKKNVQVVDIKLIEKSEKKVEEVKNEIREEENGRIKGIIGYKDEKIVQKELKKD